MNVLDKPGRAQLWHELVATRLPHIAEIENSRRKVRAQCNSDVGCAYTLGHTHRLHADRSYVQNGNGSFTCAAVYPDKGPHVELIVWWSYRTPIALMSPAHSMSFESSYRYSITTSQHMNQLRRVVHCEQLRYDGHVGNGDLTAELLIGEARVRYEKAVKDIIRRRKAATWLEAVAGAAHELANLMQTFYSWRPVLTPMELLVGEPKAYAKVTGWTMRDGSVAGALALINDRLTQQERM